MKMKRIQTKDAVHAVKKVSRLVWVGTNGLVGNRLPKDWRYPKKPGFRYQEKDVSADDIAEILLSESAKPEQDVVFFVHGLMVDDSCWQNSSFNMPATFADEFGVMAVNIHYDSGKHIWENGQDLANTLEDLYKKIGSSKGKWHIVAFSMGGLVTHSAISYADESGFEFIKNIDRVFLIATPHRGAPLEKGVQALRLLLKTMPDYLPIKYIGLGLKTLFKNIKTGDGTSLAPIGYTTDFFVRQVPSFYIRLPGYIFDLRSEGILDLRYGYISKKECEQCEEWGGLISLKQAIPALPHIRYYAISGSLSKNKTQDPSPSPLCMDGMVSSASAANIGPDDNFHFLENNRYQLLPGLSHFVLSYSKEAYEVIAKWFRES